MDASLRIEIFPADVDVTTSFYQRLGFQVAGQHDGPPRYASLRLGAVRIGVCEADRVDPARRAYPAMTEIVIDVDDVQATRDAIVEQGIEPTEDLRAREWGLTDFRVTDPDGYYLRFTGRRLLTGLNSLSQGAVSET
jgi:catechol 2,3-dioxygenase-like lactoylglutathione lyase family enzyme